MNVPESGMSRLKKLFKLAEIVLVLPHSNAELERLFSIVWKNKTDSRSRLMVPSQVY